jgi:hypothetical protein
MEKREAKRRLEEISASASSIAEKYHGEAGHRNIEKKEMLEDFQAVFAESESLKRLFEEIYDDMPESFNTRVRCISDYASAIGMLATLVSAQCKV